MSDRETLARQFYAESPAKTPFSGAGQSFDTARAAGVTSWVRAMRRADVELARQALRRNEALWGKDPCGCQRNAEGDIRCHKCFEYVNKQCWNCRTGKVTKVTSTRVFYNTVAANGDVIPEITARAIFDNAAMIEVIG